MAMSKGCYLDKISTRLPVGILSHHLIHTFVLPSLPALSFSHPFMTTAVAVMMDSGWTGPGS